MGSVSRLAEASCLNLKLTLIDALPPPSFRVLAQMELATQS